MKSRELTAAFVLCIALLPTITYAQTAAQALPGGAQLGMSADELRQAVPEMERIARPARMAGGLVGNWRGPAVQIGGVRVAPTYFFAEAQLRRVEYIAQTGDGTRAFDALLAWGRAAWGAELASQEPEGRYATWSGADTNAYLQQTGQPQRGQVRLVIAHNPHKDAGEL